MKHKPLSKLRNKLVLDHLEFAHGIAQTIKRRLPPFILLDDLVGEAHLGLMKAARKYNFKSGVPFTAYAFRRIRGAVIDSIRRRNFQHTSTYQLNDYPDQLDCCQVDDIAAVEADIDYQTVMREVRRAVATLPPPSKKVIELRYGPRGLNGKEAGKVMGIGKVRSSVLHRETIEELRRRLGSSPHGDELKRAA